MARANSQECTSTTSIPEYEPQNVYPGESVKRLKLIIRFSQTRPEKINCPSPHSAKRQLETSAANLLQEQELPPTRPPREADTSDQTTTQQEGCEPDFGETEEATDALPAEEVRCQGRVNQ